MANDDRNRYAQDRFRSRDDRGRGGRLGQGDGSREDDGYIARRGFGNRSAGYDQGGDQHHDQGYDHRYDSGRERDFSGREQDFGASSGRGYGDVFGQGQGRPSAGGRSSGFGGYDQERERGYAGGYGAGSRNDERGRYGASDFGRGSRGDHDERGFLERAGDEIRSWFGGDEGSGDEMRHHRGRGPKNYTRSDARILEDVNDRLTDDPHVDASEIHVEVQNREVTLTGTVNSRFEKRHAEDLAESVSGVTHVQNNLRVQQSMAMGMGGSALSGSGGTGSGTGAMGAGSGTASGGTGVGLVSGASGSGMGSAGSSGTTMGSEATKRGRGPGRMSGT